MLDAPLNIVYSSSRTTGKDPYMMISVYKRQCMKIQQFLCVVAAATASKMVHAQSLMGYTSVTDVSYQTTIDVDQQQIENILSQITGSDKQQDQAFIDQAYAIYTQRLRSLSSEDGSTFRKPSNENEFLSFFSLYVEYMGSSDFAHDFITAGFNDTVTAAGYTGNFQLVDYSLPGGLQNVIQLGTVILTLVQYIIRNVDVAIEECIICVNMNDSTSDCGVSLIDEAAAYYVGSLQSSLANSYEGYLLYGTADRLCQLFNTCDGTITVDDSTVSTSRANTIALLQQLTVSTSRVNMIALQQLTNLQANIQSRLCNDDTTMLYRQILVSQLFVPIVQGLIRSVHYTEQSIVSDYCSADATMYAAAILPLVNNCTGSKDAKLLFDQTKPNRASRTNATLVNEILQRSYDCLGISSNDIGTFDADMMVEWGRCGQPTPAPVVPSPISLPPTSAPSSATVLATTAPAIPPVAPPVSSPTATSGWIETNGTIHTIPFLLTIILLATSYSL